MSKSTPGPWTLTRTPTYWGVRCGVSQRLIAQVAHKGKASNSDDDARLIAAAPDMLSTLETALRHAREAMPASERQTFDDGGIGPSWMFSVRTMIARAKGL